MTDDNLQAYEDLMAAIVIQAAGDFVDAYVAGLITDDNRMDIHAVRQMIIDRRNKRCRFPKWMDCVDVQTAVLFLFEEGIMEEVLPQSWTTQADAIRNAVSESAEAGRRISSYFNYAS